MRFYLVISAIALSTTTYAATPTAVSAVDRTFVATVSQGGMFEVKAGELATDRGNAPDIKDQGSTEAHDHKLVGDKLKSAASEANIDFSSDLNDNFKQKLAALKSLSGLAFDAAYLKEIKDIHAKDGAAFAKEAATGTNPGLRSFAAETHAIVLMHIGELHGIPAEK